MKGVSEIIAIILILMIVIALAALAYTWFSGVFASMTGTASTAVTSTTNAMSYQFSIDTAKGQSGLQTISLVVRNTGTQTITDGSVSAYVNDAPCTNTTRIAVIPSGTYSSTYGFSCPVAVQCTSCNGNVCYNSAGIESVKVTAGTGLTQIATITCTS